MFKNKKGMMDDLFDFMFTVFMAVIFFALMFAIVNGLGSSYEADSVEIVQEKMFNDEISLLLANNNLTVMTGDNLEDIDKIIYDVFKNNYGYGVYKDGKILVTKSITYDSRIGKTNLFNKEIDFPNFKLIINRAYEK